MRRIHYIVAATLVVVFCAAFYLGRVSAPVAAEIKTLREGGYQFINPVLLCNINLNTQNKDEALAAKIQNYINSAAQKEVGVYYINYGVLKWSGVNIDQNFSPASMLKVPTMTAILRYVDEHPEVAQKEIWYDDSTDTNKAEYLKPKQAIQPGHAYTVSDLLTYMIEYSDNNAAQLLDTKVVPQKDLAEIYLDLNIELPANLGDIMSPHTYADFLRLLYNGTYLTRQSSEKALELMSKADFPQGIRGGVPSNLQVAEKFGERTFVDPLGAAIGYELHDCGLIYGANTYLLCVMTRGSAISNYDQLAGEIRDISKLVYDYQAAQ